MAKNFSTETTRGSKGTSSGRNSVHWRPQFCYCPSHQSDRLSVVYTMGVFIQRVIAAFNHHDLTYALVGGHAVALHGAVRGTVAIDLVIDLDRNAYIVAEQVLIEIGLVPRLPVSAENVFNFRDDYIQERNLVAWSFVNPDNPLEVVDIIITEDLSKLDVTTRSAFGLELHVITIEELIRMKRQTGRAQDTEDVRALEYLL